eukprot:TRINITY_DN10043_c0_g1_i1.p1 TRINITY_DN10043_c0_g1~~TRINITY_DN10043_c0_g1_i1.p1  ORF type:complete len:235 (+),score=46.52 TRINITY_DN10043_c0_g1_i1:50-706(+)
MSEKRRKRASSASVVNDVAVSMRKKGTFSDMPDRHLIFRPDEHSPSIFWSDDNYRHLKPMTLNKRRDLLFQIGLISFMGTDEELLQIIEAGAEVNGVVLNHGETSLHRTAFAGSLSRTLILLQNGASPNMGDWDGRTALHVACRSDRAGIDVLEALLTWGADPLLKDKHGNKPSDEISSDDKEKKAYMLEWEEMKTSGPSIIDLYRAHKRQQANDEHP